MPLDSGSKAQPESPVAVFAVMPSGLGIVLTDLTDSGRPRIPTQLP